MLVRALSVHAHLGACGSGLAELAVVFAVARPAGPAIFRRSLGWLVAGALASLVLYLPLIEGMTAFRESWSGGAGDFGFGFAPLVLAAYAGGRGLSIWVWCAAAIVGVGLAWRRSPAAGLCLALWPVGILAFYALNATVHYPWAFARFFFPALPAFAIAIAVALDALATRLGRRLDSRLARVAVVVPFLLATSFKTPEISFGRRDTPWPQLIRKLETSGIDPRDALVIPLRFNSIQHYLGTHPTRLDATLRAGGPAALANRRLAFVVDLVDFDDEVHGGRFDVSRFGPTTLLIADEGLPRDEGSAVAATRDVLEAIVHQWGALPRGEVRSDWIYWRIDRRHEHAFVPESDLAIAWSLLARVARAEGDTAFDREARARVVALDREIRRPGEVRSAWSLLGAHWDGFR